MITALTIEQTKEMLIRVADEIIAQASLLTEIDSKIGDGDHGIGMSGGLTKVKDKLLKTPEFTSINQLFGLVGQTMMMTMGGASGIIFGTMFSGGAKTVKSQDTLDSAMLAAMMQSSLNLIQERGKAKIGDKTMVDALSPAVDAMLTCESEDLVAVLTAAETAALSGVEDTKKYIAKIGRAKTLFERSIGFQDAGATSVWIIFKTMKEYVLQLEG